MRDFFSGICIITLVMFSTKLAAAAENPSLSGTTIPSATQIVDATLSIWTLSSGVAYENGNQTPSSDVILLLCYGGVVYQENSHHLWWLWDTTTGTWATSVDPRVISPGGTTVPAATQIIDSELDVWTLSGGRAYQNGELTPSSDVILLLYAKGLVYQENSHHDWWYWRNGAWVSTSAPLSPSASGTSIPTATEIIDNGRNVWTLSGGKAYENHELTPSSDVILLLFFGGSVYQENNHHLWWEWNGQAWKSIASDPRVGQPLAYVASATAGKNSITVIDTGTTHVKATIPIGFKASYMAVTPNAKRLYVASTSNVAVIDAAQGLVTTIELPPAPSSSYGGGVQGIAASPDGTMVYVLTAFWLNSDGASQGSTVYAIDTATNAVVATADTPDYGVGITISPDGKKLYLPSEVTCQCASNFDGTDDDAWIDVIDTKSRSLVSQAYFTRLGNHHFYATTTGAVISPNSAKLYVNDSYFYLPSTSPQGTYVDEIAVFNPATGVETSNLSPLLTVQVFSPDSQHLYGVGLGGVGVIDTATEVSSTAVANIPGASNVAITPDGKHLYITDTSTNSVRVADTATYTISTVIPVSIAGNGAIAIVSTH